MREQSFRYQLVEYIHNRLEAEYYEAFFDEMAKIDPVLLQSWIAGILDQEDIQNTRKINIPDLSNVHQKVLANIYSMDPPKTRRILRLNYWAWASCAALLICALSVLYIINPNIPPKVERIADITWYENNHSYAINLQLPDSTGVILYPNSKVSFVYDKLGNRVIQQLRGRVIYKVHKNPAAPFQVDYKGYITTALGTVFSIDPQTDDKVRIKLMEGKISVGPAVIHEHDQQLLYLNPNEEVLINLLSHQMTKSSETELTRTHLSRVDKKLKELIPNLNADVEWTNQSVNFTQTKNAQLLEVIESLYDVSIICDNPDLLTNSFTGSLSRKESLEKFLANFCQLNGCSFRIDNGIVHIDNPAGKEGSQ
ncbi:MAG: FecR family protein [Sphingobacterium sp.]|nr:FecR family protein [Sphingobacterium sp.]